MKLTEQKKYAKAILAEGGVKVYQKDVKSCIVHQVTRISHEVGEGLKPDIFCHRETDIVQMIDGTVYKVLRETVDKDGNFSTNSAKMVTREVMKKLYLQYPVIQRRSQALSTLKLK